MDRHYRPDRDRDRDRYNHNHRDRDDFRDRDRDFHHQPRRPSRFSDAPPLPDHRRSPRGGFSSGDPPLHDHRRSPRGGFSSGDPPPHDHRRIPTEGFSAPYPASPDLRRSPRGGFAPGGRAFNSPPRHPMATPSGPPEELWPIRGNGGDFRSDFTSQRPPLQHPPVNHPPLRPPLQHPPVNYQPPPQLSGQKRGFPFPGNGGGSPEHYDGRSFVKLFVGSVPRTATEEEIRPLFDGQGTVLEVAFIKDKRTGQQQGCCFIKYATSEEADRAIRALHNQYTLPGGAGPIQVRYADGERERIGNVEYKLFVGALNKFATEKEVEEIFVSFGRIEDVYLMRDERNQSRGSGFVKFSNKESATAAVNALNGIYTMRGCDQPLTVRFADPKRPRAGEPRASPAFGGQGFGPSPSPGIRPAPGPNFPNTMGGQGPPNAWQSWSPHNMGSSPNTGIHGFGNQFPPQSGDTPNSSIPGGNIGAQGGIREGSFVGSVSASSTSPQNFDQSFSQVPPSGQQISPLQNPLKSPQDFAPTFQLQGPGSTSQPSMRPLGQMQSGALGSYSQPSLSHQAQSLPGQLPHAQFQVQQSGTSGAPQPRLNTASSLTNSQVATPAPQQPLPFQQSPSQLAQMLSQQTQTLQASFQSSQQAFSQLQQQVQMMQPSTQNQQLQQSFQAPKQQSQWAGAIPTTNGGASHVGPTADVPPSTSSGPFGAVDSAKTVPAKCNWTEHTSPDGHKYYYNSATGESRWVKPEELTLYEQQQKIVAQQSQAQAQPNLQTDPIQQFTQQQQKLVVQQPQLQAQPNLQTNRTQQFTQQQQKLVVQQPQPQAQPNFQTNPTQQFTQQQKLVVQQPQPQAQLNLQTNPTQQFTQSQPSQLQPQFHGGSHFQRPPLSSIYPAPRGLGNQTVQGKTYSQSSAPENSVNDPARFQQRFPAAQDWAWNNSRGN